LVVGCVFGKDFYSFTYHVLSMNSVSKVWTLAFVVLLLSSLLVLTVVPVNVQAASKPSVPQFTVKLVDYSYDVSPSTTTTTDPYTGEKITTTNPGYYVENIQLEVTIKNQPFTPYIGENGRLYNLYYTVQVKGHFGENWQGLCYYVEQTDSQYTVATGSAQSYVAGSQLDFRVQAAAGYADGRAVQGVPPWIYFDADATSNWSKIQTFTMPSTSSLSPSQAVTSPQNPTAPPDSNQPQSSDPFQPLSFVFQLPFLLWVGAIIFVGVVVAVVMLFLRRHLKTPTTLLSL